MIDHGVFGGSSAFEARYIPDYQKLGEFVQHCRCLGMKIVLTSGSFDLIHIGHALYLEKARSCGSMLIVGVDSDAKIEARKHRRSVVPEIERLQTIVHLRCVDVVTLKSPDMGKWALIKVVHPDVLVRSSGSKGFTAAENEALKEYCGEVVVLPPQAVTSTSARIRRLLTDGARLLGEKVAGRIPSIVAEALKEVEDGQ